LLWFILCCFCFYLKRQPKQHLFLNGFIVFDWLTMRSDVKSRFRLHLTWIVNILALSINVVILGIVFQLMCSIPVMCISMDKYLWYFQSLDRFLASSHFRWFFLLSLYFDDDSCSCSVINCIVYTLILYIILSGFSTSTYTCITKNFGCAIWHKELRSFCISKERNKFQESNNRNIIRNCPAVITITKNTIHTLLVFPYILMYYVFRHAEGHQLPLKQDESHTR
jgi:hypothetical protein